MASGEDTRARHEAMMASDGMIRILAAQVAAIVPLEMPHIATHLAALSTDAPVRVLSVGCGTGEFERAILRAFPSMPLTVTGVDIDAANIATATSMSASIPTSRLSFQCADALALPAEWSRSFDLVLNRHMIHLFSRTDVDVVLAQMARVTRPGGILHVLAEDYGMIHFAGTARDSDVFWRNAIMFGDRAGGDWRVGRKMLHYMRALTTADGANVFAPASVSQALLCVDSHTNAKGMAAIWQSWADAYTDIVAANSTLSREEVAAYWSDMIAAIEAGSARGYGQWLIPLVTATVL